MAQNGQERSVGTFTVLREHVSGMGVTGRADFRQLWKRDPQEAGRRARTSFMQRHFGLSEPASRYLVLLSEQVQARRNAGNDAQSQGVQKEAVHEPFVFPATHIGATGEDAIHDQAAIAVVLSELGIQAEAYRLTGSPTEPTDVDVAALMAEWKKTNSRLAKGTQQLLSALGVHDSQPGRKFSLGAVIRQLFGQSDSGPQAQAEK
ncbi:MAG: hypothetical protein KGJ07_05105 [Patescibacteria group bacterium]|nr:hypothetical protein [Patescibacteria group bacterium]MDE2588712.1 hypothetical protein [Patescibacteria group bacterium]